MRSGSTSRALGALIAGAAMVAVPATARADAVTDAAARYLHRAQNPDGGFGTAPGAASANLLTSWSALGLVAAGAPTGNAGGRLRLDAATTTTLGDAERTILALRATGTATPPRLAAIVLDARRADGSFARQVNLTSFAILALRSLGRPASSPSIRQAAAWTAAQQNTDGSFSFGPKGLRGDVDDTGAALEALAASGRPPSDAHLRAGVRYLRVAQRPDGGFPAGPGGTSNAQSTAFAVQGLLAAGVDPAAVKPRGGGRSPLAFLRSLQDSSGAIHYSRTSDQTPVWVTAQALAALALRPLPILP